MRLALFKSTTAAPPVSHYDPIELNGTCLEVTLGRGFFTLKMEHLLRDRARNRDICGPDAASMLNMTGWSYTARPAHATASLMRDQQAVAAAWVTPIHWHDSEEAGLNLSFATNEVWERKGIARTLCLRSFRHLAASMPTQEMGASVNIQCARKNKAAVAFAERMGFLRNADADFKATGSKRAYLAFSMRMEDFESLAQTELESAVAT